MAQRPGNRLGSYEVVGLIGSGGMGEVYRARDTKLGRDVAIKVLPPSPTSDPERLARFQREAQVLASLNHPNIAAIYHVEEADAAPAIVMELVEGETLAERIKRGPIPLDEALVIAKQIAEALEAAHEQGIIHRDLKPANIKLDGGMGIGLTLVDRLVRLHGGSVAASSAGVDQAPSSSFACRSPDARLRRSCYLRVNVLAPVLALLAALCVAAPAYPQTNPAPSPSASRTASPRATLDVGGVFVDSLALLGIEHGIRVALQPKTRDELRGNFWNDYRHSIRWPKHWEDTDPWPVNYLGHPMHGAAAGYLWLEHDPAAPSTIEFDNRYWASRGRAAAFAAVYSFQFEIGPVSEASIGNVGLRPETTGWVDYVVTPTGAFGLVIAEDVLDKFLVEWAERHTTNRVWRASLRMIFSPSRVLSNTAAGHLPWYRSGRTLAWR